MKNITEHVYNIQTIKRNQEILMEQERLASLGQLISGIAHNLKTPIMSISGAVEALKELIEEYDYSIEDKEVTTEDHHEIAEEMNSWIEKIKPHCSYMSDIISAVKGQAVKFHSSIDVGFVLDELIKRIQILMKHELLKANCILNIQSHIDLNSYFKGDINSLVQVFDNIIVNAIHAYEGQSGTIDFIIDKDKNNYLFIVTDYAKGIPLNIQDKLLKEMITTKGTKGTGLGLYMSYSTIKGHFSGNMWFHSEVGIGTSFCISIPCYENKEGNN
jgi:signal transduction histidine kinase